MYTPEGYGLPLKIRNGIFYLVMRIPNKDNLDCYPHSFITSDLTWDPAIEDEEYVYDANTDDDHLLLTLCDGHEPCVDDNGNHCFNTYDVLHYDSDDSDSSSTLHKSQHTHEILIESLALHPQDLQHHLPDLQAVCPYVGWVPSDHIHTTLDNTRQHYWATQHYPFHKHFKPCFPAANVCHLNELFTTDTLFMEVAAQDDGVGGHANCIMVQLFTGLDSEFTSIYQMDAKSDFTHALEDLICDHGARCSLHSDKAKEETSSLIQDILKMYLIKNSQSKAHYQHQKPAKQCIQDFKHMTNAIMDHVGCPTIGGCCVCSLLLDC